MPDKNLENDKMATTRAREIPVSLDISATTMDHIDLFRMLS